MHPLDKGVNGYLAQDSFYLIVHGIIVVAAMGFHDSQGVGMILECIRSVISVLIRLPSLIYLILFILYTYLCTLRYHQTIFLMLHMF